MAVGPSGIGSWTLKHRLKVSPRTSLLHFIQAWNLPVNIIQSKEAFLNYNPNN